MNENWHDLKGQTITSIQAPIGDADIEIHTEEGGLSARHFSDCCESVDLVRVDGNPQDIVGCKIINAEDDTGCAEPEWATAEHRGESVTWAKLTIETERGSVTFWILGCSNGYYCETVGYNKINPKGGSK